MVEKLFESNVGGGVAEGNPVRKAIQAEHANEIAMGTIPASEFGFRDSAEVPFFMKKAYVLEDGEESYKLYVELITGRNWDERYGNQFRIDAVFEKLVRDYNLETGVTNADIREFFEEEAERLREESENKGIVQDAIDRVKNRSTE